MGHPNVGTLIPKFLLMAMFIAVCSGAVVAQNVEQFLADGEFSAAINVAGSDHVALQRIASKQLSLGENSAALKTFQGITNGKLGTVLRQATGDDGFMGGGGVTGTSANGAGANGGITASDFNALMQLIQGTIASDTWEANGGGNGSVFPYPTGVYVDGEGVLNRISKARQSFATTADFEDSLLSRGSVYKTASLRKVSLTSLERAVQLRAAQGKAPTETMLHLAGLTNIRYVMIDPDLGEVIIAGPAGGWKQDAKGNIVSKVDQQPVLFLDDFVVCLRNARNNRGKFGCAIVPRKENLAATKQYVSTAKGSGKKWENGLREALGLQDIDVFGIPESSHAARVLVEADHHMKLLGMGIEPSIPSVPSYLQRVKLDANGNPPSMDVVRWWFALNYEKLLSNESQSLFEFTGPGVKVLAETEFINDEGDRIHTGTAVGPTKTFARDFTNHFEELSDVFPVYHELKNIFDLAIVANIIHEYELSKKANWEMPFFVSDSGSPKRSFQISKFRPAGAVESVMNRHVLKDRRGGETTIHTLVGVSGGVSFDATKFVNRDQLHIEGDIEFTSQVEKALVGRADSQNWWWD